jgi:hypothetical protein
LPTIDFRIKEEIIGHFQNKQLGRDETGRLFHHAPTD